MFRDPQRREREKQAGTFREVSRAWFAANESLVLKADSSLPPKNSSENFWCFNAQECTQDRAPFPAYE